MTNLHDARVTAAAKAMEKLPLNLVTRAEAVEAAMAALAAADAVVTVEMIAEVLRRHVLGPANGGTASWSWINCSCHHRIEIAGVTRDYVLALGREHQARAVLALLRGGEGGSE